MIASLLLATSLHLTGGAHRPGPPCSVVLPVRPTMPARVRARNFEHNLRCEVLRVRLILHSGAVQMQPSPYPFPIPIYPLNASR